ncbi:MAG: hypothetical protein ACLR8Y_01095 [Alistipes indistinctus]
MLPKADGNEEARALLLAEVELGDADAIVFACTHIDFTTPQTRMQQCRTVAERLSAERYPVIVGGISTRCPARRRSGRSVPGRNCARQARPIRPMHRACRSITCGAIPLRPGNCNVRRYCR